MQKQHHQQYTKPNICSYINLRYVSPQTQHLTLSHLSISRIFEWYPKTRTRRRDSTWIRRAWLCQGCLPSPPSLPPPPPSPPPTPRKTRPRRSASPTLSPSRGRTGPNPNTTSSSKPFNCNKVRSFYSCSIFVLLLGIIR